MNPTLKRYLLSSATTFVTIAAATLAAQVTNGVPIEWTATFWLGVAITVLRAGVKAVIESMFKTPPALG